MTLSVSRPLSPFTKNSFSKWLAGACAAFSGVVLSLILVFLLTESSDAIEEIGGYRFFSDQSWYPELRADSGSFGLVPMLIGSAVMTAAALLIAAPIGVLSAVFGRFYAPPCMGSVLRRITELLAGVPSVVYGLWGLVVLVPIVQQYQAPGLSILAGSLVLALMLLPTISFMTESGLQSIPSEIFQNAEALALSRSTLVLGIALPHARSSILVGILLAGARAIGETMVVVMVCGNVVQVPRSMFDSVRTLTANIALEMSYAFGAHRSALFFTGLILISLVATLIGLIHLLGAKTSDA